MNVLIVVLAKSYNSASLDKIISKFDEADYHISVFHNCEKEIQLLQDLPLLVDYVKNTASETVERIVVLSNIREFVCAWYRIYNTTIDDYIYYVDEYSSLEILKKNENQIEYLDFYKEIASLNSMEVETTQGKIYININLDNIDLIGSFLFAENRFAYFQPLGTFVYESKMNKQVLVNKKYIYDKLEFTFERVLDAPEKQIVVKESHSPGTFTYNPSLMQEHYYFFFFLLITLYKLLSKDKSRQQSILINILESTYFTNELLAKSTYDWFYCFCQSRASFYDKIYFGSLFVKYIKYDILELLINVLLADNKHIAHQYPFLINILFYQNYCGLKSYPNLYRDREKVLNRIVDYYRKKIKYLPSPKKRSKNIAVVVPQLKVLENSPTLCILNYVKCFKENYPEYQFKIFVDELFAYPNNEITFPFVFSSTPSEQYKSIHKSFLQGTNTEIFYSDLTRNRIGRIQEILNEINEFTPELIFGIDTEFCITRSFLYERYPFVDMCLGNLSNSLKADYYITGYDETQIKQECEKYNYNLDAIENKRYLYKTAGVNFPEPVKKITRESYNIGINDFIMVTVGNRLDAEVTNEFVDLVCSFLTNKSDAKWFIVGKAELFYLKKSYPEIVKKQIIFVDFESDLAALYNICDIYLNPFRMHGGYSAGMAMAQSLPIVTLGEISDVAAIIAKENTTGNEKEYFQEIERLYYDKAYKEMKGAIMKKRINEKFSMKDSVDDIIVIFTKAIKAFYHRK